MVVEHIFQLLAMVLLVGRNSSEHLLYTFIGSASFYALVLETSSRGAPDWGGCGGMWNTLENKLHITPT